MEKFDNKLDNLKKSLDALDRIIPKIIAPPRYADSDDIEAYMTTLVKRFELVYEMTWKFFKVYIKNQFGVDSLGSKDVFRQCFMLKIIQEDEVKILLEMVESRNMVTHEYDQENAQELCKKIIYTYQPLVKNIMNRIY